MPGKKQGGSESPDSGVQLRLIANLLGLLATKDMGEGEKIATLSAAGFGNQEIAKLLEKDVNTVNVTLSLRRKKTAGRKRK